AYFITICVYQRQCLFGEVVNGVMQLNKFGEVARSHWLRLPQHHAHVRLDAFVIMPNHMHGIIVLTAPTNTPCDTAGAGNVGAGLAQNPSPPIPNARPKPAPARPYGDGGDRENSTGNDMRSVGLGGADFGGNNSMGDGQSAGCDGAGFDGNNLMDNGISAKPAPPIAPPGTRPGIPPGDGTRSPNPIPSGQSGNGKRHGIPEIVRGYKTFSARRINRMRRVRGVPVWQRNYWERIIRDDTALRNIRRYIDNNPATWQHDKLRPQQ
ncbi:MAG: hypothetical protein AAF892_02750, partial [Cyanobacteria bacterium P01_D01_bin.71]